MCFRMCLLMVKRVISGSLVCIFTFILGMTAADYCGPKPKEPRLAPHAALLKFNQIKFKKAHHPCASLDSPYDLVSIFRLFQKEGFSSLKFLPLFAEKNASVGRFLFLNDLSPPFANPPPQAIPIFQLNSNLRI